MRRSSSIVLVVVAAVLASACEPAPSPPDNRSVATVAGAPAMAETSAMTPDGRFIAFASTADGVVAGFNPGRETVYRLDRTTGAVVAVSVDPSGNPTTGEPVLSMPIKIPNQIDISADGRFVVFDHLAANLVPGPAPSNARFQTYVRDLVAGTTVRIQAGTAIPDQGARYPRISDNGRYVAFLSSSTNLGPAVKADGYDVYRWDRLTGAIDLVSAGRDGAGAVVAANRASYDAVPTDDGRVVFWSSATNLLHPGGPALSANVDRVYLADPTTGAIEIVSRSPSGAIVSGRSTDITPDGRYAVFQSGGAVIAGDTNGVADVFVRDLVAGTTTYGIPQADGKASGLGDGRISSNGRFVVARGSNASVVVGDSGGVGGAYVRDRQTGTAHHASRRADGSSVAAVTRNGGISDDGHVFVFDTNSTAYVVGSVAGSRYSIVTRTPVP